MRLAKIKLAGFKSFVEPTTIPVTNDLVGIVGPNGCGKSNIIDAVRWVLGESKASALRGDSMQDVIFGGSANRKAIGRASVELVFDNSLGHANGQWSSYADIAIKRIIQRDGNSNYYINNIHVRRRDIADLFLGTGVGGHGYAIIEQGMISRITEAKPQDLKTFLEEAAGISKYRERRHETTLRLTDTRKNLIRIEDIVDELRKQIEHLEDQARVAKEYTLLNTQLQETQQLLWLQQKVDATQQRIVAEEEIEQSEQLVKAETQQLKLDKEQREEARILEQDLNEKLHETQGMLYSANAEKTRIEQEISQFHKNQRQLAQQIQEISNQLTRQQQQLATATENLQHWHTEKQNASIAHQSSIEKNQQDNEQLPELESIYDRCQKAFDTAQQKLIQAERADSLAKMHIQHTSKTIQQLESRRNRLKQEHQALPEPDHEKLTKIQSELASTESQLTKNQKKLSQNEQAFSHESSRKHTATAQVHEIQHSLSHLQAQFNALHNLQKKTDNNEAIKLWLKKHELDALPRLWHFIQIEKEWENALESVLQHQLNSFEVPQLEIINDWKDDLPPGKLSIYELQASKDACNPEQKNPLVSADRSDRSEWIPLASYLTCSNNSIALVLNEWLNNIYVVEDIYHGLTQKNALTAHERLVTPEGHSFSRTAIHFHSPDSHLHGVLSRQRELNQTKTEITVLEKKLQSQKSALEQITAFHEKLNHTIQSCRREHQQLTQRRHHLQLEQTTLAQKIKQVEQRNKQVTEELKEINQQLAIENQQKQQAEKESSDHQHQVDQLKTTVQFAKNDLANAGQLLAEQRQKVQDSARAIQQAAFDEKVCINKISDLELTIKKIEEDKLQLSTRRDQLLSTKQDENDTELKSQLDTCIVRCKHLEQTITENRNHLEQTRQQILALDNKSMASENKLATMRESISQLHLKKQAACLSEERYQEQLNETTADETSLISRVGQKSLGSLQSEINRVSKSITALGSVNLAALDELEASRQREATLNGQIQDLNEAITILENAVEQIEQETKKRLQKTFDAVNNNLKEIFPIIFSGGKAELILNDGKILDAGLLLTAQPPGKKNNSIHLLSGGEKALTALALIFSLFRLNPAPFCLLDEVDAPLDDSNTGRFCELVKKLSEQTQFLFISHNKITMEIAQQLIGITMQEQGVSKVVAVDIANIVHQDNKDAVIY